MATNFKIKGQDINTILETFTHQEQIDYEIPDSEFTNGNNDYKHQNTDLQTITTIPTSAGNCIGGIHLVNEYKKNGQPIDAALRGRRPIGQKILTLNASNASGFYTIYRKDGQLFYAPGENVTTGGTRLCADHDPEYIHIEMQGPGCGGGGSATTTGGQGGSAGAYFFISLKADKVIIKNSPGLRGGGEDENAPQPDDSSIWFDYKDKTYKLVAAHGRGGTRGTIGSEDNMIDNINSQNHTLTSKFRYGVKTSDGQYDGGAGYPGEEMPGTYDANWVNNFNSQFPDGEVKLLYASEGGWGLARDSEDKGYQKFMEPWQEQFNRPETYTIQRGQTYDGWVDAWQYGGGGGPSVLASGGKAVKKGGGQPGTLGSGGAGGGWISLVSHKNPGGAGGHGIVYIYY